MFETSVAKEIENLLPSAVFPLQPKGFTIASSWAQRSSAHESEMKRHPISALSTMHCDFTLRTLQLGCAFFAVIRAVTVVVVEMMNPLSHDMNVAVESWL